MVISSAIFFCNLTISEQFQQLIGQETFFYQNFGWLSKKKIVKISVFRVKLFKFQGKN